MNRRRFLQRFGAAVIGLTLARHLPGIAPAPPVLLQPTVYEMDEDDIMRRYIRPAMEALMEQMDHNIMAMMSR